MTLVLRDCPTFPTLRLTHEACIARKEKGKELKKTGLRKSHFEGVQSLLKCAECIQIKNLKMKRRK